MNPQIVALHDLQTLDRRFHHNERRLDLIHKRLEEFDAEAAELSPDLRAEHEQKTAGERQELMEIQAELESKQVELRKGRVALMSRVELGLLSTYERIRRRGSEVAFVAITDRKCSACKMKVPHQIYVNLRRGVNVPACDSCERLLFWSGHFPESG